MIHLKIATPDDGVIVDENVEYVDIISIDGHYGLQGGITPMVAKLKTGPIFVLDPNRNRRDGIVIDGVLYVDRANGIKIMASKFLWNDQIDLPNLEKRVEEISKILQRISPQDRRYLSLEDELHIKKSILEVYQAQK